MGKLTETIGDKAFGHQNKSQNKCNLPKLSETNQKNTLMSKNMHVDLSMGGAGKPAVSAPKRAAPHAASPTCTSEMAEGSTAPLPEPTVAMNASRISSQDLNIDPTHAMVSSGRRMGGRGARVCRNRVLRARAY